MQWQNAAEFLEAVRQSEAESDDLRKCKLLEEGVQAFPDSPELLAVRAYNLCWMNRPEEAFAALEKAGELGPQSAVVWAARAAVEVFHGRNSEALTSARRALAIDDSNPLFWAMPATPSLRLEKVLRR